MENNVIIDLNKFRTPGARVFTGRPRGEEVRTNSKVDELETKAEHITVRIPEDTITINPSFLEEFFRLVVRKLGPAGFRQKFVFDNPGAYKIQDNLDLAIERILRGTNALAQ